LWETRRFGVNGWGSSFLVGLLDIWWFLGVFGFGGVDGMGVDACQSDSAPPFFTSDIENAPIYVLKKIPTLNRLKIAWSVARVV